MSRCVPGCPLQVHPHTLAVPGVGPAQSGGAADLAAETSLQPVHLDLRGEHEGGGCGGAAPLQEPQRVLQEEAEATGPPRLRLALCGETLRLLLAKCTSGKILLAMLQIYCGILHYELFLYAIFWLIII